MSTPKSLTPRTDAIVSALKAAMKPYNKYKTTATAMLLIAQYIKIAQLEIDLTTLQAEVVELRKDKERLDWLQEHPEKFFSGLMDDQDGNPTRKSFMAIPDASKARHDVREAIDLALTQPTP